MTSPSPRHLTDLEKRWSLRALRDTQVAPEDVCRRAVEVCQLLPTLPKPWGLQGPRAKIAHIALAGRAAGITLGTRVYIREGIFGADGADLPLQLVVHEVAHVAQYLRDGHVGFLARYLRDYAANLLDGMGERDAYLAIPHELEARRADRYIIDSAHHPDLEDVPRLFY